MIELNLGMPDWTELELPKFGWDETDLIIEEGEEEKEEGGDESKAIGPFPRP